MAKPTVDVLGVYSIPVTDDLLREQTDILHGADLTGDAREDAEEDVREQLESTVLIEVLVRNRDKRFDVGDFSQAQDGVPRDSWQVAWAEAYLSEDGNQLLVERWGDAPKADSFGVAFFIHYWNPAAPLLTSYGEVRCPTVNKMPERLQKLVPYVPVD
mgnify:CR=1 FL=1|uniref:Uncharacterized protein n=1 Tax=Schlesneria paludicola TaxID=360056 RepID=A0A7C4LKW8_9PLAN